MRPRLLILNAALNGRAGNTAVLLNRAAAAWREQAEVVEVVLAEMEGYATVREAMLAADGFIIGTGTHWDSWSSLLQKLLEDATDDEGRPPWFGKPAGVLVTMHAVGGKQVASRLQGVLSTLGCLLPPMSALVYSYANQLALRVPGAETGDLWRIEDVDIVAWNVLTAARKQGDYRSWPVDRERTAEKWIE